MSTSSLPCIYVRPYPVAERSCAAPLRPETDCANNLPLYCSRLPLCGLSFLLDVPASINFRVAYVWVCMFVIIDAVAGNWWSYSVSFFNILSFLLFLVFALMRRICFCSSR